MALARLRQLAAHEVGHTLGLMHNYSASTVNRASVMDYPPPLRETRCQMANLDVSERLRDGHRRMGQSRHRFWLSGFRRLALTNTPRSTKSSPMRSPSGQRYLTDQDARPAGSSSTQAHLLGQRRQQRLTNSTA